MANTVVNREVFVNEVQAYLRSSLVAKAVADMRLTATLGRGEQLHFTQLAKPTVQDYTYSTDGTREFLAQTDDTLTVAQIKQVYLNYDPIQNAMTAVSAWQDAAAEQAAYELGRAMDQHFLSVGASGAGTTVAGGSISSTTIASVFGEADTALARKRVMKGMPRFAVVEPSVATTLGLLEIANGFNMADAALKNGYIGDSKLGFKVFISPDLPCSVALTLATNPTAADTITVYGVTFTFVASVGSTAGNVLIGANAAATQANLRAAVNGSAGAGSTYVEVTAADRTELTNANVALGAFSTNVATLGAFGRIGASETLTAGGDGFGSETCAMLFGQMGALKGVALKEQMLTEKPGPGVSTDIILNSLYQAKVFGNFSDALVKVTCTV